LCRRRRRQTRSEVFWALTFGEVQQNELDILNELSQQIVNRADQYNRDRVQKETGDANRQWAANTSLLETLRENLVQLQQQWDQLESILQELEVKSNLLLEKDRGLDLVVHSRDQTEAKKHIVENLLEDKTALGQLNTKANALAKTLIKALREQKLLPQSLEEKLTHLNDINTRLSDNLAKKERQLRDILTELQHYLDQIGELAQRIETVRKDLTQINPFDERLYQTERALGAVKEAAESCSVQREDLRRRINEQYLPAQKFVPSDLKEGLELLDRSLTGINSTMEDYQGAYKKAKMIRTDYFTVYDRIKTWIEQAELTISNHGIDPSELKSKLTALTGEFGDMRTAHEQLLFNGNEIVRHCTESSDRTATQANMDQLTHELDKTIALIEQKNQTVDQILGNWANFMRLYQSVVDWSIKIRALLERKLQLNTLHEAQQACQNYSGAVASLADVSQNLSEMNHEFDKINEVCSTAYLRGKLHEAETLKIDIETVLFERNLFLHETTEEWQQYERKIESVREWIKDAYQALNSGELKSKPLRDQLRILEQMLADISAQKIKVNMSLEKLQVHFHSDIIYTDNPTIVQSGRTILADLDKLNLDVFQTTQNLDQALAQIEGCQAEMQTIRQRIVHEEQQLRNILSPLHQTGDSEKHEQECRERIRGLQSQMNQLNDKIKLLLRRGAPDP
uniref:Muscle-specific protein 300 n=1 Tax=Anopheles coluzzii TaxID=1518534 RepID=A0A8W7PIR3_ANOCL